MNEKLPPLLERQPELPAELSAVFIMCIHRPQAVRQHAEPDVAAAELLRIETTDQSEWSTDKLPSNRIRFGSSTSIVAAAVICTSPTL